MGLEHVYLAALAREKYKSIPVTKIFNACLTLGYCPKHFKTSITVVLRKTNKPSYEDPKA